MPARVVRADVGRWRPEPVDVVVADPSRAGLGRAAVRVVVGCHADRVVLVSCDAAAFARDVALLRDGGYELRTITPVDLFPHTPHVECVAVLDLEP
jgi:23S rRNA (uracil1939-C5)-methyltransferase